MLKDLFDKGKCLVGLHQGQWKFDAPARCTQTRLCPVCSTKESRTEHTWSEWNYRSSGGCEQSRQCTRCREQEAQLEHQWGAWAYDEAHRAPVRSCERCSERVSRFPRQSVAHTSSAPDPATADGSAEGFASVHDATSDAIAYARVLIGNDAAARQALFDEWLTEQLPASMTDLLREAFSSDALESRLSAACMLAEPHARGRDPQLGVAIGQAVCMASEAAYPEDDSPDYLFTLANGARVCLIGYDSQGKHDDVIRAGSAAVAWLEGRGYTDSHPTLLMHCIDAHLQLHQLEDAGRLLAAVEKLAIPDTQPAERRRRADLRRKFDAVARRSATELAPDRADPEAEFRTSYADLQNMVSGLREMDEKMFGVDSPFRAAVETLTAEVQGEADQAAWIARTQASRGVLTELLSGGLGGMTALRNRDRAINAAQIFSDPTKGRDPASIEASLAILLEAREWARTHDCGDDEDFALWALYLCYSRTQREPEAIEVLQTLRSHLEAKRMQIAEPMKRAGVFLPYPYLFGSLCRLLCRANRGAELLGAMEGAKGRVLADALTAQRGAAVADAAFVLPIEQLTATLRATGANYLSYFVDDDEAYAVLVTKEGSTHCQTIDLGKNLLRDLVQSVDPTRWAKPRAGYFGKTTPLPERLAPLVDWLGPLLDAGTLSSGDHLCYCPDEYLHLVPLHYVLFRGEPLVRRFSVSRIHSVSAVTALLTGVAAAPSQFVAVQVPAQQDLGDASKVSALGRVAGWLAGHSSGMTLARERATLDALSSLDLTDRIVHFATHGVFPKDDIEGRNPNPFKSSGLALASGGALPSLETITRGASADGLLTPERVLALKMNGSHVTLQACVTGLAKEGIGGDALGLDLAFLLAGARSLLTTHWDVSAHASAEFSVLFYRKWLGEGATRGEAWRAAVLELMDAGGAGDQPGEYYWAAFSLSGDWR